MGASNAKKNAFLFATAWRGANPSVRHCDTKGFFSFLLYPALCVASTLVHPPTGYCVSPFQPLPFMSRQASARFSLTRTAIAVTATGLTAIGCYQFWKNRQQRMKTNEKSEKKELSSAGLNEGIPSTQPAPINSSHSVESSLSSSQCPSSPIHAPSAYAHLAYPFTLPAFAPLADFFLRTNLPLPSVSLLTPTDLPPIPRTLLCHEGYMTPNLSRFWHNQSVKLRVVDKEEDRPNHILKRWIVLQVGENRHIPIDDPTASYNSSSTPVTSAAVHPITSPTNGATTNDSSELNSSSLAAAASVSPSAYVPPSSPVPVEFGSIHIDVNNLPETLHSAIWAGQVPFATLLATHNPPVEQRCRPSHFFTIEWDRQLADALRIPFHAKMIVYGRCNTICDANDRIICQVVEIIPPMRDQNDSVNADATSIN